MREPILVADEALTVVFANRAFLRTFDVEAAQTQGVPLGDRGSGEWRIPRLIEMLHRVVPDDVAFDDCEVVGAGS